MADEADRAQALEELHRRHAVDAALRRPVDPPMVDRNGDRICRDCGEKIPLRRLRVNPHAVRCLFCQAALEEGR